MPVKLSELRRNSPLPQKKFDEIIGEFLKISPEKLFISADSIALSTQKVNKFRQIETLVRSGTPPEYIFKKAWFCQNEFFVDENVLIPRVETELIIEEAKRYFPKNILDLGTGSGCIAITLKEIFPQSEVTASDISSKALNIATQNAKSHKVKINFVKSDLFSSITQKFDLITANLPYIAIDDSDLLELFDPRLALVGGTSGFELIEKTISQISSYLNKNGLALFEIGYNQKKDIINKAKKYGFSAKIIDDLNGYPRVAVLTKIG